MVQLRSDIEQRTRELLAGQGPDSLAGRTLNDLNAEAARQQKAGQPAAAVATYLALFHRARQANLTHPELYVCHSNCAAAYLQLGLHKEALRQADACQRLAQASLRRWAGGPQPDWRGEADAVAGCWLPCVGTGCWLPCVGAAHRATSTATTTAA